LLPPPSTRRGKAIRAHPRAGPQGFGHRRAGRHAPGLDAEGIEGAQGNVVPDGKRRVVIGWDYIAARGNRCQRPERWRQARQSVKITGQNAGLRRLQEHKEKPCPHSIPSAKPTGRSQERREQANKEISTRFDFKGTDARVEQKERELTAFADSDFQLSQVRDVLTNKMTKRNVDVRFLDEGKIEKIGGDKVKQVIKVKNGIESDDAKKIVRVIKDSKMKVQASIQGDAVRITGAKRDDLQAAMALLRKEIKDIPLEFNNFRD
jgi:uncharacterized protein YajQ (UPF0234 family)